MLILRLKNKKNHCEVRAEMLHQCGESWKMEMMEGL